jgi:hypothetical protein
MTVAAWEWREHARTTGHRTAWKTSAMKKRSRRSDAALLRAALFAHSIACGVVIGASAGTVLGVFRIARDARQVRFVAEKVFQALAES